MFNGRIFIDGIIVLNFLVEEGICTEDAECNLIDAYLKDALQKLRLSDF